MLQTLISSESMEAEVESIWSVARFLEKTLHYRLVKVPRDGFIEFTCTHCGECCREGPIITVFDVARIARGLHTTFTDVIDRYCSVECVEARNWVCPIVRLRKGAKYCIFHDDSAMRCRIHDFKPLTCKLYPIKVLDPASDWIWIDCSCEGVGSGERVQIPNNLIDQYIAEVTAHYLALAMMYILGYRGKECVLKAAELIGVYRPGLDSLKSTVLKSLVFSSQH
ncbi:MAG: hypothetical protein DRJ40_01255 [Thermoprotei archaeon]|nr:MAG: hypothetical protein DRJ40_01255 [Thermoprotei archaeon]